MYRNTLLGLDESMKKLWEIIDSHKTEAKEKIKAITLFKACYKERLDLIKSEPGLIQQKSNKLPFREAITPYLIHSLDDEKLCERWILHKINFLFEAIYRKDNYTFVFL